MDINLKKRSQVCSSIKLEMEQMKEAPNSTLRKSEITGITINIKIVLAVDRNTAFWGIKNAYSS